MNHDNPIDRHLAEVVREKKGNLSLAARQTGVTYDYLKSLQDRPGSAVSTFRVSMEPFPDDIKSLGKPGFEKFVIAVKRRGCDWPDFYTGAISDARRKFDSGTHEMFQTKNRGFVVQYLIPRRRAVEPRKFFRTLDNE